MHVCALRVNSAQRGQKRELDPVWVLGNPVFCWAIPSTPSIVFHYFHRHQTLVGRETTCPVFLSEYVGISPYWQERSARFGSRHQLGHLPLLSSRDIQYPELSQVSDLRAQSPSLSLAVSKAIASPYIFRLGKMGVPTRHFGVH